MNLGGIQPQWGKPAFEDRFLFGDCFAYALAKTLGEPLLAKGTHFARTDIKTC